MLNPCGIPYLFGTLEDTSKDILSDKLFTEVGVGIVIDELSDIHVENHRCRFSNGDSIKYGKLTLATGSMLTKPTQLKG